jgi:hypothetical protein
MLNARDTKEGQRLDAYARARSTRDPGANWKLWGPYLSERQWGTVREDYSAAGDAWNDFSRGEAPCRAYRWGEDGLAGISDDKQRLCFSVALWNQQDDRIKERLFGLTNDEGNHGEDVKEYYFYLDSTPTHSYLKYLYKYPWSFPEQDLLTVNGQRRDAGGASQEYELADSGALSGGRYFDVLVEYAKASPEDLVIRVTAANRGRETRVLDVIPTLWFRNTWSWGDRQGERQGEPRGEPREPKPALSLAPAGTSWTVIRAARQELSDRGAAAERVMWLYCDGAPDVVFTENETDREALGWGANASPFTKDGIDRYVRSRPGAAIDRRQGTKVGARYSQTLAPGQSCTLRLRLTATESAAPFDGSFDATFAARIGEADEFYGAIAPAGATAELRSIQRQAFAGMLWNKQVYHYVVRDWLQGDAGPPPPENRQLGRNSAWHHVHAQDVLSMPDKWEYPWFAAWDLAFHAVTLAMVDPDFAKSQLLLLVMEWYQHPNGQLSAYEWDFGNVNPPVHAWAAWNVYQREQELFGRKDQDFLRRVFDKLNLNFTWWVNRVDSTGNNIFEGGFLGLDNIRIIERGPEGSELEQADGTAWMAMFCLQMMKIALELRDAAPPEGAHYEDLARKYLQHFIYIADATNHLGGTGLWDEARGFFFDALRRRDGTLERLPVYSVVGLVPTFAIAEFDERPTSDPSFYKLPAVLEWFARNRPDVMKGNPHLNVDRDAQAGVTSYFVSVVGEDQLKRILACVLDEGEFLSPFGLRSLSKRHERQPYALDGREIRYEPAESSTKIMGGNSNWRGPVWFPINYLFIQSLRQFDGWLGAAGSVEHTSILDGQRRTMTLAEVADDLSWRLVRIFTRDEGRRPVYGGVRLFDEDPADPILFYEYFHGENGAGLGASHQTGWTGLVANLIHELFAGRSPPANGQDR